MLDTNTVLFKRQTHTFNRLVQIAAIFPWSKLLRERQHVADCFFTVDQVCIDSRQTLWCSTLQSCKQLKLHQPTHDTRYQYTNSWKLHAGTRHVTTMWNFEIAYSRVWFTLQNAEPVGGITYASFYPLNAIMLLNKFIEELLWKFKKLYNGTSLVMLTFSKSTENFCIIGFSW